MRRPITGTVPITTTSLPDRYRRALREADILRAAARLRRPVEVHRREARPHHQGAAHPHRVHIRAEAHHREAARPHRPVGVHRPAVHLHRPRPAAAATDLAEAAAMSLRQRVGREDHPHRPEAVAHRRAAVAHRAATTNPAEAAAHRRAAAAHRAATTNPAEAAVHRRAALSRL